MASGVRPEEALRPPPDVLRVLDPRQYTDTVVNYHGLPGVSLVVAEILGSAVHLAAELHVAKMNTSEKWLTHLDGTAALLVRYEDHALGLPPRTARVTPAPPAHRDPPSIA